MKSRKLKQLRRDVGLTQHKLARATGIHRWRISHAELDILQLTEQEVALIKKVLLDRVRERNAAVINGLGDAAQ